MRPTGKRASLPSTAREGTPRSKTYFKGAPGSFDGPRRDSRSSGKELSDNPIKEACVARVGTGRGLVALDGGDLHETRPANGRRRLTRRRFRVEEVQRRGQHERGGANRGEGAPRVAEVGRRPHVVRLVGPRLI